MLQANFEPLTGLGSVKIFIPFMFRLLGASGLRKPAPKEGLSFCQNFGFMQLPF